MNRSSKLKTSIDRVLVVIDQDQLMLEHPERTDLLQRASDLAQSTGCELELFSVYHDRSLELSLFAGEEAVNQEKDRVTNSAATRLGEIALDMKNRCLEVSHEVVWDSPYVDALLRKIARAEPDLVMKQTHGPNYVLGLTENPDWELLRKSPSHVWFVKPGTPRIETILTAVGETDVANGIISDSDYRVFEVSNVLADSIGARNVPVHSYETPRILAYSTYAPMMVDPAQIAGEFSSWHETARLHGKAIKKFAKHFNLDIDQIEIVKGHPATVIPGTAKSLNAGLLVMGARNIGRWERVLSSVSAEPVLSLVPCDIVFVKEAEDLSAPDAKDQPRRGVPSVNIEKAITEPDKAFGSPESVVETDDLTVGLRQRILEAWELDITRQMTAEDEGGPVQGAPADVLMQINQAKESLARMDR